MPHERDYPDIMRRAFLDALRALVAQGAETVRPRDLVLHVLTEAMGTMKALPDPEAAWLYSMRSVWPEIAHTHEERLESYKTELAAMEAGQQTHDALLKKAPPTPVAVKTMHVVFDVIPKLLVGRDRRRDYRILCGLAGGQEGTKLARKFGVDKSFVYRRRDAQLLAIAASLRAAIPSGEQIAAAFGAHERTTEALKARFSELQQST